MSEFVRGMRVITTEYAIECRVFRNHRFGTVWYTPKPDRLNVMVLLDGNTTATYYSKQFWEPVIEVARMSRPA